MRANKKYQLQHVVSGDPKREAIGNNTYRTEYKSCDIEVDGMDEFELTTENGVTNDWSEVEWSELTKAIAAIPEEEEGK